MRDNLLIIRGLAAMGVVFGHMVGYPSGYIAVWLFFMLSAFLLTRGFIDGRFKSVGAFYASRARRLLPTFFFVQLVIIGLVAAGWAGGPWASGISDFKREARILFTMSDQAVSSLNSPVWSLLLEIHFIVLLPFILRPNLFRPVLLAWIGFLAFLALQNELIWTDGWTRNENAYQGHYNGHAYNAGFFLLGMMAAYAPKVRNRLAVLFALAAWLCGEAIGRAYGVDMALRWAPLVIAPAFYLLLTSIDTSYQRALPKTYRELARTPPLEALGAISYSLYLSHKFVVVHLIGWTGETVIGVACGAVAALAVAVVIYVEIESRFRHRPWTHRLAVFRSTTASLPSSTSL